MKRPTKDIVNQTVLLRLISFILLLLFFVASVFAIIVAQGNIINFSNGEIITTGTLKIESNVKDYKVFVEDKEVNMSNNRIEDLEPGEYKIRLEKDGYSSWENAVKVRAGIISSINAQLFPSKINIQRFIDSNIEYATYSNDGKYIFYIVSDPISSQNSGIWRRSLQSSVISVIEDSKLKLLDLTPDVVTLLANDKLVLLVSPDNEKLLLKSTSNDLLMTLSANRFNNTNDIEPIVIPYTVDTLSWFKDSNHFIISTKNILLNYNLNDKSFNLINIFESNPVFTISNDLSQIYFIRNNAIYKFVDKTEEAILSNGKELFSATELVETVVYGKDNIIITNNINGLYYVDTESNIKQNIGEYNLISVSPDNKNLILEKDGIYTALEVERIANNKSISLNYLKADITAAVNSQSISWAQDSSFFTFKYKDNDGVIFAASRKINNIVELANLEKTKISDVTLINKSNTEILIQIQILSEEAAKETSYIYRLDI